MTEKTPLMASVRIEAPSPPSDPEPNEAADTEERHTSAAVIVIPQYGSDTQNEVVENGDGHHHHHHQHHHHHDRHIDVVLPAEESVNHDDETPIATENHPLIDNNPSVSSTPPLQSINTQGLLSHNSDYSKRLLSDAETRRKAEADTRRGSSSVGATANFIKGMLGAGILSMPKAFGESGLWLGSIVLPLLTGITLFSMLIIIKLKRAANRSICGTSFSGPVITYQDIGRAAHPYGNWVVLVSVVALQLCFCTGWVIVMVNNLHTMLPDFSRLFQIFWLLPILVGLTWIRYIKQLVYTSFFGLIVYLFGVMGVSYYYGVPDISAESYHNSVLFNWQQLPLFMTTAVYAIGGFNGVVSCEATLKKPSHAPGMVSIGLPLYAFNVMLFGAIMYVSGYGTCSVVLDCLPDDWPIIVVKCALTLALIFTFPLGMNYALEILEDVLFSERTSIIVRCLERTVLVVLVCAIAWAVPDFSVFSNIVGSILLPFVGFILPPYLFFRLCMPAQWWHKTEFDTTWSWAQRWLWAVSLTAMLIFGAAFQIVGLYTTIIQDFS